MKAGISTSCFYPTHTEDAVRWLTERQVPQIEIFFNSMAETEPAFLRSLRQQLWLAGCRVVSVHPFLSGLEPMLFFSGYDRRQAEGNDFRDGMHGPVLLPAMGNCITSAAPAEVPIR